jgi:hypothetical protein
MTGNLSRTVLRGAGARESACLPDVTRFVWSIYSFKFFICDNIKC